MTSVDRIQGLSGSIAVKPPCRVATTAAITLSGAQTIDGVAVVEDDRVLVKDQADTTANGIYDASTGAWTRSLDFDGANDVRDGTLVPVASGTTNGDKLFQLTGTNPITIGTTALSFAASATFGGVTVSIATDRLLGRDTAGTGAPEALTVGGGIEFTGSGGIQTSAFTGDVTKSAAGTALTIANDAVTYAKMQNVSATDKVLGRSTAGAGDVEEITCTAFARSLLDDANAAAALVTLGISPWTTVVKTADETVNNSNTLQDDNELTFAGTNGGTYAVKFVLNILQNDAAADFKVDFNSLAGNTSWFSCRWQLFDIGGVVLSDVENAGADTDMSMTSASASQQFVEITLNFTLSAGANCTLRWSQNTATVADTVVKKGSYLEYKRLI